MLAQLSSRMLSNMNEDMKNTYGTTIASLAQLALGANPEAVAEIIRLLEELKQKFIDAKNATQQDEANAVTNFN